MHTEEKARTLWCPMTRVTKTTDKGTIKSCATVLNRIESPDGTAGIPMSTLCVASECAMWRWATNGKHEHDCAITKTLLTEKPPRLGFCGLSISTGIL
jgi:hypothetical protein